MIKIKKIMLCIAVFLSAAALLLYPSQVSETVYDSIEMCMSVLIPSLFPFLFLSIFIVKSGIAESVGRIFEPVFQKIFKLPGCGAAAMLAACIGGYPAGAQAISELYNKGAITRFQAQRMIYFCFCAGPAFLAGTVGGVYFGSTQAGLMLMAAQILSVILIGIFMGIAYKSKSSDEKKCCTGARVPLSQAFSSSARGAASALLSICTLVVIFSVIIRIVEEIGVTEAIKNGLLRFGVKEEIASAIFPNMMEVTGALSLAVPVGLPYAAFITAFGGICVHFQIFAFTQKLAVSKGRYFYYRFLHAGVSTVLTMLFIHLMPQAAEASTAVGTAIPTAVHSPAGTVALVVLCVVTVLLSPDEEMDFFRRVCYNTKKYKAKG